MPKGYIQQTGGDAVYGDTKHGFQTADHEGWVRLDGRLYRGRGYL